MSKGTFTKHIFHSYVSYSFDYQNSETYYVEWNNDTYSEITWVKKVTYIMHEQQSFQASMLEALTL